MFKFLSVHCAIDGAYCRNTLSITSEDMCRDNLLQNFVVLWMLLKTFSCKLYFVIIVSDSPKWSLRSGYNG